MDRKKGGDILEREMEGNREGGKEREKIEETNGRKGIITRVKERGK